MAEEDLGLVNADVGKGLPGAVFREDAARDDGMEMGSVKPIGCLC